MANFVRRLRRESRIMIFAQSLGAIISGFLAWSGFLILLDLYDAFSPIQETEVSSWIFGAVTVSLFCFLALFIRAWISRPGSVQLARQVESANPELRDLLNSAVEIEEKRKKPGLM